MPNAKPKAAADLTLTQIGSSKLYAPPGVETWAFLLWDATTPKTIALSETWSDRGTPGRVGDYAFLLSVPSPAQAPKIETVLRGVFGAPNGATGFGWFRTEAAAYPVPTTIEADLPIVAAEAKVPAGPLQFYFTPKLPIVAARDSSGAMNGLLFTDPRPAPGAGAYGVVLPLLGPLAGCIVFLGALQSTVIGDRTVKKLANARIDPLRLTNKERTRITPTGVQYVLSGNEVTGYHFLPYSP